MKRWIVLVLFGLLLNTQLTNSVVYAQHSSTNYRVDEYFFGAGGGEGSSSSYDAWGAIGNLGIGFSESSNYELFGGHYTPGEEFLEMNVNTATIDFGTLDTGSTATGTGTFNVKNYLSHGYVVTTVSTPPSTPAGAQLDPITTAAASSAGTEQFGMNLKANTSPTTFGADPVQVPDATFSFGTASSGYDTANLYQYNQGDTIAESSTSTGETDYTISYIMNIDPVTEAGEYTMLHTLVVVSTF